MTRLSRPRRLAATVWLLATASSCIWPQPVNEQPPPPTQTDVAPTINSLDPASGPLPALLSSPNHCQVTVRHVVAQSPLGGQLFLRFYLNYQNLNGLPVPDAPILGTFTMQASTEASCGTTGSCQDLGTPQTITLQEFQGRLRSGPNTLWVWVSDGFKDENCNLAQCLPDAKDGFYSTSFSWTIDFTQCPNFPPPT